MEPLVSTFADDPAMTDLIPKFLGMLGERLNAMRAALAASDLATVRTLAHQIKGAAGGYGYPSISRAAAALEAEPSLASLEALEALYLRAKG
jgi:HPt (histidine-containing phosphotransfer) domain-containing protein